MYVHCNLKSKKKSIKYLIISICTIGCKDPKRISHVGNAGDPNEEAFRAKPTGFFHLSIKFYILNKVSYLMQSLTKILFFIFGTDAKSRRGRTRQLYLFC